MKLRYLDYHGRPSDIGVQVSFVPAETINCVPPYVAGKPDSCWIRRSDYPKPKDQAACERAVGMKLLPLP